MFPAAARFKPSPLQTLTEEALIGHVNAAIRSMTGYKKEEQTKFVAHILYNFFPVNISEQINGAVIDMTELQEYLSLFEKHEWEIPVELEAHKLRAIDKSTQLKQMFDRKMTYEEAIVEAETASKEKVRTAETKLAIELAEKAKRWVEKAQSIQRKWVAMKTLQRMVNETKGFPVILPFIEEVRQRFEKAHEWY